jgi:hypothetical protein
MHDKENEEKNYFYEIEIFAQKKQDIEACAKAKGITFDKFIKEAINQSILECKLQTIENDVLPNQLKLFNEEKETLFEIDV